MSDSNDLNEVSHAENPARELVERLRWTYVPREMLADDREVLLKGRLWRTLLLRECFP